MSNRSGLTSLQSIYIGGGTPTALSVEQIQPLFDYLHEAIQMEQIVEFSIEANPENLTEEKVEYLLSQQVSRFSLGVQTFHENTAESELADNIGVNMWNKRLRH